MFNEGPANYHIHCTVKDCKYHKGEENYCSLDTINVATHESHPTDVKCVDCKSFQCKNDSQSVL